MRNRYPGTCYRCGEHCAAGEGHFEKAPRGGWRVQHADCAIKYRGTDHHFEPDGADDLEHLDGMLDDREREH